MGEVGFIDLSTYRLIVFSSFLSLNALTVLKSKKIMAPNGAVDGLILKHLGVLRRIV